MLLSFHLFIFEPFGDVAPPVQPGLHVEPVDVARVIADVGDADQKCGRTNGKYVGMSKFCFFLPYDDKVPTDADAYAGGDGRTK